MFYQFVLEIYADDQVYTVDESRVFAPPSKLQVPDTPISNSDSALSAPDSDDASSSASSSPTYAKDCNTEGSQKIYQHSPKQKVCLAWLSWKKLNYISLEHILFCV